MVQGELNGKGDVNVLMRELAAGGISGMIASAVTNPLDAVKTRVQAQVKLRNANNSPIIYDRFWPSTVKIVSEEGFVRGLVVPGLSAALLREVSYSSIRFGLYGHVKTIIVGGGGRDPTLSERMLSGMITGGIGSALANPTDLVKIRMQSEAGKKDPITGLYVTGLRTGGAPSYRNSFHAFYQIYRDQGLVKGLYRGSAATSLRAALLTGGQLASYEQAKIVLKGIKSDSGVVTFQEGVFLHALCSLVSSFTAATVSAPADFIKTRLLADDNLFIHNPSSNSNVSSSTSSSSFSQSLAASRPLTGTTIPTIPLTTAPIPVSTRSTRSHYTTANSNTKQQTSAAVVVSRKYRGVWDCFYQTVRQEGVFALYRGWLPSYLRLAPHFIIAMPVYEQLRVLFGLSHL